MVEEQTTIKEEEKTTTPTLSETLQQAAFGDDKIEQQTAQAETIVGEKKKEEAGIIVSTNDNVEVPLAWLKKEFDIEDPAILKAERDELKTLKANPAKELQFADDESKHIYEVVAAGKEKRKELRQMLETQERLEDLVTTDVSEKNADDILKLNLKLKYKDLNEKEIEHKFNKTYGLPKEPVQSLTESDDDFVERQSTWKESVEDIKMSKIIDAKTAKPELEKYKSELVLPRIQQNENQSEKKLTQEDLNALKKTQDSFFQSAEQSIKDFNGFSVQVKDKDVDYTVSYTPSQEEKTIVSSTIKKFAESNFNANALLAERWVNEDLTINEKQMTEDLLRIFGGNKVDQKLATDSGNKRLDMYFKEKKQINVNEQNQSGTSQFTKNVNETVSDKLREVVFS